MQQYSITLNLNNIPLPPCNSVKYFGIYIDEQLNFQCHIECIEQKISRAVGILSKLKSSLPKPVLVKLYYAFGTLSWFSHLGFYISLIPEKTGKYGDHVTSFYTQLNV